MIRLSMYELLKIWRKKRFVFSFGVLLVINLFLLWYVNLPDAGTPPLSAYKAFEADISVMSEKEKADYITGLKDKIDGITFVERILCLQAMGNERSTDIAQQELEANPGVFEEYYEQYQSGEYLFYTDELAQETALIHELYEEFYKVSRYEDYLNSIQESKNKLSGISIFQNQSNDSFSNRNIVKSAADYENMRDIEIRWQPSKGIILASENSIADILLFLGLLLFVGNLIIEEKERKLFYITRPTKHGMFVYLFGKLGALLLHSCTVVTVMIGSNLIFAAITTGVGDMTSSIQSLAPYMESNLSISIWEYLLLSVMTKSIVLFCFGAILTAVAIDTAKGVMPYFIGILLLGISALFNISIPAYSVLCPMKYLNFIGAMDTGQLYGEYLNLNINEHPISRLALNWSVLILFMVGVLVLCLTRFLCGRHLELKKARFLRFVRFRQHGNLFRHEAYKILITNRAVWILLCFAILIGYYGISQEYHPSVKEEYYQKLMLQLEGEFTEQKEQFILSEQARFEEATKKVERIDTMVQSGELDILTADAMKTECEAVLSFYSTFERIETQYVKVKQEGGEFIYDTGYLYLYGKQDNSFLICALLLSVCMVLSFYNSISMEYRKKSWFLLGATECGRRKIIVRKIWVCLICAAALAVVPWVFRGICISEVFPMSSWLKPIRSIPAFEHISINMSILCFTIFVIISQMISIMIVALLVMLISGWQKNNMQSLFFGLVVLVIPMVLKLMGFDFAGYLSIYPFYAWTGI